MKNRFVRHALCAVTGLGLAACAGTEDAYLPIDAPITMESEAARVLAETEIPGGMAQFVALDAETLLVVTDTVGVPRPLQDEAVRGFDAAQLYEHWAADAAPPELVALVAKTSQNAAPDEATAPDGERNDGVAALSLALTDDDEEDEEDENAAAFRARHCPSGGGKPQYCYTRRTGEWERSERARTWMGFVEAVEGDVSVQMRRRKAASWTTDWVDEVAEGHDEEFLATSENINQRQLKFKIFEADDSIWNFAGSWN